MITAKDVKPNFLSAALIIIGWINFFISLLISIYFFAHIKEKKYSLMGDTETVVNEANLYLGFVIFLSALVLLLIFNAIAKILINQQVTHIYLDKIGDKVIDLTSLVEK